MHSVLYFVYVVFVLTRHWTSEAAQSNLADVMLTADADKSDTLSFQEFLTLMKSMLKSTTAESDIQDTGSDRDRKLFLCGSSVLAT